MEKVELQKYFIEENHTLTQCAEHFKVSVSQVRSALKRFGIKKEQELKIDRDALYKFYIEENHTFAETLKFFNISKTCLFTKLKKYNIVKDESLKKKIRPKSPNKVILDKDELHFYYITQNLSRKDCAEHFKVSEKVITRRLEEFNIKKDNNSRYLNVRKAFENKYGVKCPSQTTEFKEKMRKTNEEKYGVPYACMREECRKYSGNNSIPNKTFSDTLKENNIKFEREFSLESYSYDFKIGNYLFEINPSAFHNSTFAPVGKPKDKHYHEYKTKLALENGYRCIHVWDWDDPEKIVSLFLKDRQTVYARKCVIKEVTKTDAMDFINKYHLQKYAKDAIRIGLFFDNELLSVMTFDKPRYNGKYQYELVRYCSKCNVIGGAERIWTYFLKKYEPKSVVSYCDMAKFDGEIYHKLGFKEKNRPQPSKHWYNLKTKQHITDNLLRQKGFDQLFGTNYGKGTSNEELMKQNGFVEIYDCGQVTYVLNNIQNCAII